MILRVKFSARVLMAQNRALFAFVFAAKTVLLLLLSLCFAAALWRLRGGVLVLACGLCAAAAVYLFGACSAGSAFCRAALARGLPANRACFFAAFRFKTALRFALSALLSFAVQLLLSALLCVPFAVCVMWLLSCLRRGFPAVCALLFSLGAAAAGAATLLFLVRLHALFLWRVCFLAAGAGVWRSVCAALSLSAARTKALFSLQRSFFFRRLSCVLLFPLPFVRAHYAQSCAVLFEIRERNLPR